MADSLTSMSTSPARPLLSVIIPTHDTRELTLACLRALATAAPASADLEILVVDDASTDGTAAAIAAAHPQVIVLRRENARGFTPAANEGLAAARGDVLLLLNSDTEVEPGGLDALGAALVADPRLGAAGATLHYPDGTPQWSGGNAPTLAWLFALASGLPALLGRLPLYRRLKPPGGGRSAGPGPAAIPVDWVTGAALALRREAWNQVAPLDESFRFYAQDLDLCLRLRAAGWTVAVLPGFRVLHHHGATIGKSAGASQHFPLLWADLLRWARKSRPTAWVSAAAFSLAAGACLRLTGRRLALPFLPASRRPQWKEDTARLAEALAGL
jgi:GT2 family glycosyltransferase